MYIPDMHRHHRALTWLGIGTSIKINGAVKLNPRVLTSYTS